MPKKKTRIHDAATIKKQATRKYISKLPRVEIIRAKTPLIVAPHIEPPKQVSFQSSLDEPVVDTTMDAVNRAVRASFTMAVADQRLIEEIKKNFMMEGIEINKSEIIRAGIHALCRMPLQEVQEIVNTLEKMKAGQPRKLR